jgi:hypothetical protein
MVTGGSIIVPPPARLARLTFSFEHIQQGPSREDGTFNWPV